jgi:hypothetical protein
MSQQPIEHTKKYVNVKFWNRSLNIDLSAELEDWEETLYALAVENRRTSDGAFYFAWWDEISSFFI